MSIQTSDADLRNQQQSVFVDNNGVLQSYAGVVIIGTSVSVGPGLAGAISDASRVNGTISSLVGGGLVDSYPSRFISASSFSVSGQPSLFDSSGGGENGVDGNLTEGPMLTSNGNVSGGGVIGTGSGGSGSVNLDGTKTSWVSFSLSAGNNSGTGFSGGNSSLTLASTQGSATLVCGIANPNSFGSEVVSITLGGTVLSAISLTLSSNGWGNTGAGPQIDISGSIASDASINAIVLQCIATGISNGILNAGGTCAVTSSGTQANISTLQGMGWNVTYKS